MSGARLDFALIHPLVYPLETWVRLRKELSEIVGPDGSLPPGLEGTLHLKGTEQPFFGDGFGDAQALVEAFPRLLEEASAFPCVVMDVPRLDGCEEELRRRLPAALTISSATSHLVIPRNGELLLLHLASGEVDVERGADPPRGLQQAVRAAYVALLADAHSTRGRDVYASIDVAIEQMLGEPAKERAEDVVEPSGGHLFTLARSADAILLERLKRVHQIQEGSAADERALLLPDDPDAPCYAHFGWAYTTVATPLPDLAPRLLFPLIAVNQAWYRYRRLRGDLIDMSRAIQALDTDRELVAQTDFYNQVVLDVRVWEAEREAFERGLRPVYRSAYDRLWEYWDTAESKATVHEGIDYLRDFLDRKYNVKIAIRENTQSRILFVIAIFQLLSVFGLISGYLYFWEKTPLPDAAIFESDLMVWATIVSPIVVLVLIVWLLWDFFRRHR